MTTTASGKTSDRGAMASVRFTDSVPRLLVQERDERFRRRPDARRVIRARQFHHFEPPYDACHALDGGNVRRVVFADDGEHWHGDRAEAIGGNVKESRHGASDRRQRLGIVALEQRFAHRRNFRSGRRSVWPGMNSLY